MKLMKIFKILLLVAAAAAVIFTGAVMYFKFFAKKHILDGPGMVNTREGELTAVSYTSGGGMEGGYTSYDIAIRPDCTTVFTYEHTPYNGAETVSGSLEFDSAEYFDRFRQICRDTNCLLLAEKGKKDELILLDAPVENIAFYLGEEIINFNSGYIYPSQCDSLFSDIILLFKEILQQNNITDTATQ